MSSHPAATTTSHIVSEAEIDDVIAESGGAREAVRALLHDMTMLLIDADKAMARDFLRGKFSSGARRPDDDDAV